MINRERKKQRYKVIIRFLRRLYSRVAHGSSKIDLFLTTGLKAIIKNGNYLDFNSILSTL